MKTPSNRLEFSSARIHRVIRLGIVLVATFLTILFLYVALRRMNYPFDVEWVESGMMTSVARVAQGKPLYVAPSPDYVPFLYAPLYIYAAALMTKAVGLSMTALRAVSILATVGSCITIFVFIYEETNQRLPSIAGSALFVGCYALSKEFYDMGRVDALFVFLLLLALLAQRRGYPILAGLLWAMTVQTKQAVLPVGAFILCADWRRPKTLVLSLSTFIVLTVGSIVLLNYVSHGWYTFYVFSTTRGLPIVWKQAVFFLTKWVIAPFMVVLTLIVARLVSMPVQNLRGRAFEQYAFISIGIIGGIWFVAAHRGSTNNAYIPLFAWLSILFGVSAGNLLKQFERTQMPAVTTIILSAVLLQLLSVIYNPGDFIPNPDARAKRALFIQQLKSIPGDVYVYNHSWDAVLAGKTPHAEGEAFGAVLDSKNNAIASKLHNEIQQRFATHAYSSVVVDTDLSEDKLPFQLNQLYPVAERSAWEGGFYLTSQPQWFRFACDKSELWSKVQPTGILDSRSCPILTR